MRIVSLLPSATESLFALGLGDQLVAVTHECDYPPEAASLPVVTRSTLDLGGRAGGDIDAAVALAAREGRSLYEVDTDAILRLEPDLVVAQDICDVCAIPADQVAGDLAGVPMIRQHPHTLAEVLADIDELADACGADSRPLMSGMRRRIEAASLKAAEMSRVRGVFLEWIDPPYCAGHWTPDLVSLAGIDDPLARPGVPSKALTWEQVRSAHPELLVLAPCGFDQARAQREADALRRKIDLAGARQVIVLDGSAYFNRPGPRLVDSLEVLVALESELRTLDPLDSSLLVEREVFYNMYDSLFTIDPSLKIKPGLVKTWDVSDPLNYKFTLQSGVQYHDGTPFNAASVKANIARYKTAANSRRKSDLSSVQTVEVVDDTHVVFHLSKANATLLATLVDRAGMMLSMDAVAKGGANFSLAPTGAGSGPFQFVEWKRNDHLTLKKNPSYWRSGLPYLDGVTYRAIPDVNAILAALKTGDADIARTIAAKDVAGVKADTSLVYRDTPAIGFNGFELNAGAPPFSDPAKRQAVAMAVDRYSILKNINFNIGVVAYGPIPPSSWAFDSGEKVYDHADAQKAKATATGFTFTFKTTSDPVNQQAAQLLQSELAQAGITMQIQTEEFATYQQECANHQFQACNVNWSGRIDPDGNMYAWWHTGGDFNDSMYSNSQVDAWLDDARTSADQAKRKQDYDSAQKQIVQDAPYVFTTFGVSAQVSSAKIHNFTLYPDLMIRMAEVWKG